MVLLKIVSGVVQYVLPSHVISLPNTAVNDGVWHHVQVQWTSSELTIDVDYGLAVVSTIYNLVH